MNWAQRVFLPVLHNNLCCKPEACCAAAGQGFATCFGSLPFGIVVVGSCVDLAPIDMITALTLADVSYHVVVRNWSRNFPSQLQIAGTGEESHCPFILGTKLVISLNCPLALGVVWLLYLGG